VRPRSFRLLLRWTLFLVALAAWTRVTPAHADSSVDGTWKQGPLKEEYTVQKWLSACGPAPATGSSGGGESISVHQEGDELAFLGGGRVFRTNQCYDQLPTLVRETHTRDPSGKTWRTRCTTPPSDPRRAAINTLVTITSDKHIDIAESGRYEISLTEGKCTADIKRSRGLDLVSAEPPAAATPTPTPASTAIAPTPTANPCGSPGEPKRLEARPSRKLLRTGDTFTFRAIVLDEGGCATRTGISWSLADPTAAKNGVTLDGNGKLTVAPLAAEGTYELIASAAGKSARVSVEIASPSHYDDLLASSGLNDAGESEGVSTVSIAGETLGGADAKAQDGSARRRTLFIGVVVTLVVILGVVAIVGSRRARRAEALERAAQERHKERLREVDERRQSKRNKHDAALRAHESSLAEASRLAAEEAQSSVEMTRMLCPACRREYDPGSIYCPDDSNRLVPINGPLGTGPSGSICPTCKRGFDPGVKICPHDQDELIPYALFASRNPPSVSPPRGKICPTCGGRFDGNAAFCGKDGTALVLLN
jgi:hypothetical protein